MLEISPSKVALVITKAREFDARVEPRDEASSVSDTAMSADEILESRTSDAVRSELAELIASLSVDVQANLVGLAWVGRGLFEAEEFDEAVTAERDQNRADYIRRVMRIVTMELERPGDDGATETFTSRLNELMDETS